MFIVQGLGHDLFKAKIKYSRHLVMEWDFDQVLKVNDMYTWLWKHSPVTFRFGYLNDVLLSVIKLWNMSPLSHPCLYHAFKMWSSTDIGGWIIIRMEAYDIIKTVCIVQYVAD